MATSRASREGVDGEQAGNVEVKYVGALWPEETSAAELDHIQTSVLGSRRWVNVFKAGAWQITCSDAFVSRLLSNWSVAF